MRTLLLSLLHTHISFLPKFTVSFAKTLSQPGPFINKAGITKCDSDPLTQTIRWFLFYRKQQYELTIIRYVCLFSVWWEGGFFYFYLFSFPFLRCRIKFLKHSQTDKILKSQLWWPKKKEKDENVCRVFYL